MADVVVVIGVGGIGLAIARRQGIGKTPRLADFSDKTLQAAAEQLRSASCTVETRTVDLTPSAPVRAHRMVPTGPLPSPWTGYDLLIGGGVVAAMRAGKLTAPG